MSNEELYQFIEIIAECTEVALVDSQVILLLLKVQLTLFNFRSSLTEEQLTLFKIISILSLSSFFH